MTQQRILIICDDPSLNTGYARVGRFVGQTLHEAGYRVRYLPCNATYPDVDRTQWGFELDAYNPSDRYNNHAIAGVITTYKPSLVMVFGEFIYMGYIGNVCRQYGIQSMYYMPVEGQSYPPSVVYMGGGHIDYKLTLQKFNYIVAYSQFGADNINRLLPGIVTSIVPHQVDTSVFRPLDRRQCLQTFFPQFIEDGLDKVFIVGAVGRNQCRKGTDLLVQGFARFVKNLPIDSGCVPYLFMTTDPKDSHGYNLYSMVDELGLRGHVIINPVVGGKQGPADNQLCEIYNTFDVHASIHRAEGFGLCLIESLACGIRSLTTNYATPAIFGKDVCDFVPVSWMETRESTNTKWAVVDPFYVGEALAKVYDERAKTKQVYQPGVDRAAQFDNKIVARQWVKLLADLRLPDMAPVEDQPVAEDSVTGVITDYLNQAGY